MTDSRPTWAWTNDMRDPSTIYVASSFKDELGVVFIGIGDNSPQLATGGAWSGEHKGIWLQRAQVEQLVRAVRANTDWAEAHGEDCPDDCACQDA